MKNLRSNVSLKKLMEYYDEGEWRKVLSLIEAGGEDETIEDGFFSWLRPTESNLRFISSEVEGDRILSVGCGSGLLEWLIHEATGVEVLGLETDPTWWAQPYRPPTFLPLHFCEETTLDSLCRSRPTTLLFCYFNSREAFDEYIRQFEGKRVIIVGPGVGRGTHTNPQPFVNSLSSEWGLEVSQEIGDTKDFIAVYTRR